MRQVVRGIGTRRGRRLTSGLHGFIAEVGSLPSAMHFPRPAYKVGLKSAVVYSAQQCTNGVWFRHLHASVEQMSRLQTI